MIIYNIPETLEGTPAESRTHDTHAISEVLERVLAPSESVKILWPFRLRNTKRPTAYLETPCPNKVILSSATERDLILSRKSILRTQKSNVFFHKKYTLTEHIIHKALLEELSKRKQAGEKNLAIRRTKIVRLDHNRVWDSPIEISGKMSM